MAALREGLAKLWSTWGGGGPGAEAAGLQSARALCVSFTGWYGSVPDAFFERAEVEGHHAAAAAAAATGSADGGRDLPVPLLEVLIRSSAYLVESRAGSSRVHVLTSAHNVAPWKFPAGFPQEWLRRMNENHTMFSLEKRDADGNIEDVFPLDRTAYLHPRRDLAVLHFHPDVEDRALEKLQGEWGVGLARHWTSRCSEGDRLSMSGHEVVGESDERGDFRQSVPVDRYGVFSHRTAGQVFVNTGEPLTEGMCGGPVLQPPPADEEQSGAPDRETVAADADPRNRKHSIVAGMIEGIVPHDYIDQSMQNLMVYVESPDIEAFLRDVETGGAPRIVPMNSQIERILQGRTPAQIADEFTDLILTPSSPNDMGAVRSRPVDFDATFDLSAPTDPLLPGEAPGVVSEEEDKEAALYGDEALRRMGCTAADVTHLKRLRWCLHPGSVVFRGLWRTLHLEELHQAYTEYKLRPQAKGLTGIKNYVHHLLKDWNTAIPNAEVDDLDNLAAGLLAQLISSAPEAISRWLIAYMLVGRSSEEAMGFYQFALAVSSEPDEFSKHFQHVFNLPPDHLAAISERMDNILETVLRLDLNGSYVRAGVDAEEAERRTLRFWNHVLAHALPPNERVRDAYLRRFKAGMDKLTTSSSGDTDYKSSSSSSSSGANPVETASTRRGTANDRTETSAKRVVAAAQSAAGARPLHGADNKIGKAETILRPAGRRRRRKRGRKR